MAMAEQQPITFYRSVYGDPKQFHEIQRNTEGQLWKGEDVRTVEDVTVWSGVKDATVQVLITPQNIPNFQHIIEDNNTSIRSRHAQLGGVEVGGLTGKVPFLMSDEEFANLDLSKPFLTRIRIRAHVARPYEIKAGSRVYRYFHFDENLRLNGENLFNHVSDGRISIGRYDAQWQWYGDQERGRDRIEGVFVPVNQDKKLWIPPSPNNEPISIADDEKNYRAVIDSYLQPAPQTDSEILWIGETPPIHIQKGIDGVIDPWTYQLIDGHMLPDNGYHVNSRLIDGGSPNWPIRVEIVSPTNTKQHYVLIYFYKKSQ